MKNIIKFEPLLVDTFCHILTLNNTKILINCGLSSLYTSSVYSLINTCDCILITSFDKNCIGGLYAVLAQGFYKPVYMSLPVYEFSLIFNEIEYKNIIYIKYLQPFVINNINVCAYNCGNSLGACLYKISHNLENIYIGYNINHRRENHLEGIDLKKILDCYCFITNTKYVLRENINISLRNELLINFIQKWFDTKNKKMVIYVSYTRFHELCCILNNLNKKIYVVDLFCDKFINKSRNMAEWSNSKYSENGSVYQYSNIQQLEYFSMLKKFDICILLNKDVSLVDKYNNSNLHVLFIDESFSLDDKEVYEYIGTYEDIPVDLEEEIEIESSDEEVDVHWSDVSCEIKRERNNSIINFESEYSNIYRTNLNTMAGSNNDILVLDTTTNTNISLGINTNSTYTPLFTDNTSVEMIFKTPLKIRNYDSYGGYINKEKFKLKLEKKHVIEQVKQEKIYVEKKILKKKGFTPKFTSSIFNLQGTSDLKNIKVILQNIESKKIVLVNDNSLCSKLMYSSLIKMNVLLCNTLLDISSTSNINIVNVSDILHNMKTDGIRVHNMTLYQFVGKKIDNKIEFIKKNKGLVICNTNELMKKILDINMNIKRVDNTIIIGDTVSVIFDNERILLEGGDSEAYYFIRDFIYNNVYTVH